MERGWSPDVLMGVVLVTAGALIAYLGRFWSFFFDEWGTILYRRSGGLSAFLAPHNGHLQATVVAVYRLLFATVGLRSYRPYQAVIIVAHLALVGLVYIYAKRRLTPSSGQVGAYVAVFACVPLLLLGDAWQVIFWAINLGFVLPLIAFVLMLLWRRAVVTAVALTVALASSGLGVAVAVGALILASVRPERVKQLVAVVLPVAAYALWWLVYRPSGLPPARLRHIPGASPTGDVGVIRFPGSNLPRIPGYVLHSARAAVNAVAGIGLSAGWWVLLAFLFLIATPLALRRRITAEFLALLCTALVFWGEVALTRAQFISPESPGASRYLYPGAVLLLLLAVEAYGPVRIPWPAALALAAALVFVVRADIETMRLYSSNSREAFAQEASLLRRAQCDSPLPTGFELDRLRAPGVTPRPYLAAVHELGSPPGQSCR